MESENEVIRKCQAGDWSDFGQIYDEYIKKIYGFIYSKTMHKEVAEDLTSATFLKAVEKIQSFNADTNFSAWLFTIARNSVIDHFRTQKRNLDIDDFWDLDCGEDFAENFANQEILREVRNYLKKLRPEQRELVLMRVWGNMSFKEISAATGKSEGSLKMAFSRILGEMKQNDFVNLVVLGILIK